MSQEAENRVASLVTSGFVLGEGPRWHNGRFWFSDIFGGHVYSVEETGDLRVEVTIHRPSGLGWLPDGSLVVSTPAREKAGQLVGPPRIVRVDESGQHNLWR
jgi:sugar lactone lactonase YvrE